MATFSIKRNDTSPSLLTTLTDAAGTAVDLTGATVRFHMNDLAGTNVVDAAVTVVTAASGIVRYDWDAADTAAAGLHRAEFEVTYSDSTVETFPNDGFLMVNVLEDLA